MANSIYVGNPDQQKAVIDLLMQEVRTTPQGIYVVGGGGRVGKNSAITKIVEDGLHAQIGQGSGSVVRPDVNMYHEETSLYLGSWKDAYEEGSKLFVFGEIPIIFDEALKFINDFYQRAIHVDHNPIKVLFNVISKAHPAWQNTELRQDIESVLQSTFPEDLHLQVLHAEKETIVRELWKVLEENHSMYQILAKQLGFETSSSLFWKSESAFEYDEYCRIMMDLMAEKTPPNPERR